MDDDFLSLYLQACGTSEVPEVYHYWSAISLIAACLNDRVWYEKHHDAKLYANLYVALVGPSGCGKDTAVKRAAKFARGMEEVHKFHGKLTGAALADELNRPAAFEASAEDRPTIWLTLPELANSIGKGTQADDFIKRITALYSGDDDEYREITRGLMQETKELKYGTPLLNCLFGSTQRWLIESVTPEAVESGAFGRILTIPGTFNPDGLRITNPEAPEDYDDMMNELHRRIKRLVRMEGRFYLSKQAAAIRDRWYQTRPAPSDERLLPSWRRADDSVLKVAMALQASDSTSHEFNGANPRMITSHALVRAQRLVHFSHASLPDLLQWAARARDKDGATDVNTILRRAGRIAHSAALKKVAHYGIDAGVFKRCVATLMESKCLGVERTKTGAKVYVWRGH